MTSPISEADRLRTALEKLYVSYCEEQGYRYSGPDFPWEPDDAALAAMAALNAQPVQPAQPRPINCGTGHCSCIECLPGPLPEKWE